jgi:uncharacterized protein (TIGR02266 family)
MAHSRLDQHPDRRDGGRLNFDVQIGVATSHRLFVGLTSNISAGGLFIATEEPLKKGDTLDVRFQIPGTDHVFQKKATVCWTRPIEGANENSRAGAGVKLDSLSDDEAKLLNAFLQTHDAIFYDV